MGFVQMGQTYSWKCFGFVQTQQTFAFVYSYKLPKFCMDMSNVSIAYGCTGLLLLFVYTLVAGKITSDQPIFVINGFYMSMREKSAYSLFLHSGRRNDP